MTDRMGATLFLMIAMATVVRGNLDTSVCMPVHPADQAPVAKPVFPNTFEVYVEGNIENKKYTTNYHLYFDNPNQRAAVYVDMNGTRYQEIYSFSTSELFHIDITTSKCSVTSLSDAFSLFLFGSVTPSGRTQIYSGSQTFHFGGDFAERYIENTNVRGIQCNLWRSCRYWPKLNSTMTVDWYFTTNKWQTSTVNVAAPVRAQVYGRTWTKGVPRDFNHTYEFVDFTDTITDQTAFQTPVGVYCPKRKQTKPLPTPAIAFHFTSEIIYLNSKNIAYIDEYYDYDLNLVRYDSTPITNTPYGMNPQTTIHDFNTGVAYHIDDIRGNCTPTPISMDSFDVKKSDATDVRIRTSREFFYFDKANYTYEGTRSVRGMLADVWVAQRSDWPDASAGINSTWEWYILARNYTINIPDTLEFGMPIRMTLKAESFENVIYNTYAYDERRIDFWSSAISACYNAAEQRDFTFLLPGNFRQAAGSNMESFKYAVIKGIIQAGSGPNTALSALRISNLRIDYADSNDIVVQFTLLDKAPQIGDVTMPQEEQDLNTVANSISTAINNGKLVVKVMSGNMSQDNMIAKPVHSHQ